MDTRTIAEEGLRRNRAHPRPMPPEVLSSEKERCAHDVLYFIRSYCAAASDIRHAYILHLLLFSAPAPTTIVMPISSDELSALYDLHQTLPTWMQAGIEVDDHRLQLDNGSAIVKAKVDDE